jgi:hypothetical protein
MIQFLVFDYDNDTQEKFPPETAVTIEDYLNGDFSWKPNLNKTILIFDFLSADKNADAIDRNDDINTFGRLDSIITQLLEVENRLNVNKFAVLRTDTDNQGCFFIFEPQEDNVLFSFLDDLPEPYFSFYPQVPSPQFYLGKFNQQLELYNYISQHRTSLIPKDIQPSFFEQTQNVSFLKNDFLISLREQITLATEFLSVIATK